MTFYLFAISICMGAGAWCFFAWAVKDGQMKNVNDAGGLALEAEEKYN